MVKAVGVLTSGGDAQGMNAALRAVVRGALTHGLDVFAIFEGYQGMVEGGSRIRRFHWNDVGGIMQRGGTVIGTARSTDFRTREGRLKAAKNLVERGINGLVVIGGDGSLTGANLFRQEWPDLVANLVLQGAISKEVAASVPNLAIAGLVGSIDNDMFGTDMTIGADSALHRITEAIDAIRSTAASHQRAFVVEVMGRNCGYLTLMGGIAGGADWMLIPENPPTEGWEQEMCHVLKTGRAKGRRESIVLVAEGARDRRGAPITVEYVKAVLQDDLKEDVRITILGHVQRGGKPSAFDRWMPTLVGYAAVKELLAGTPTSEPKLIGMRYNRLSARPLMECVRLTQSVPEAIKAGDYARAMQLRGSSYSEMFGLFQTLAHPEHGENATRRRSYRLAVLTAGPLAPGMNTAVFTAVRLALGQGHTVLGVADGFEGLIKDQVQEMQWGTVEGWETTGGALLGINRYVPTSTDLDLIARTLESHGVEGLLVIGGWEAHEGAIRLLQERSRHAALRIPIICLPAAIDNNLPFSEQSIGADTALNTIVEALDKVKESAVAAESVFVVEVMGRACGYLALMSGLASGAERVYLPEEGLKLSDLLVDLEELQAAFAEGKRLGLLIRNEDVNPTYTATFITGLLDEESHNLYEARQVILGTLQQGGSPSPFDRIQATRLAARCLTFLTDQLTQGSSQGGFIGIRQGRIEIFRLEDLPQLSDDKWKRPREQWWLDLRPVMRDLAKHNA